VRAVARRAIARNRQGQCETGCRRNRQVDGLRRKLHPGNGIGLGKREAVFVMKTDEGKRTIDGLTVTVDGRQLSEHYEVKRFTTFGFEWTYEGDSPRQLALAILVDYLGDNERALRLCEPVIVNIMCNLDNDWRLTGAEIETAVQGIKGG